jgi:hypothetical protein
VSVTSEIEAFLLEHRDHGQVVGDATQPRPNGYQVSIACPCGVTFSRWVTPEAAVIDLAALARLN